MTNFPLWVTFFCQKGLFSAETVVHLSSFWAGLLNWKITLLCLIVEGVGQITCKFLGKKLKVHLIIIRE